MSFARLILASVMAMSCAAQANEEQVEAPLSFASVPDRTGWAYSLSAGSVTFDTQTAAQEGIDDTGFILGFDAEYLRQGKPLGAVIGFGWVGYGDNRKIVATTIGTGTGNSGDISTESSDASAIEVHGEYGLRHRFGPNKGGFLILRGGYLLNLMSERAISNCTDCPSEDVDISGGLYALTGIGVNTGETFALGLTYKKFFTGDFDQSVSVEFRWSSF